MRSLHAARRRALRVGDLLHFPRGISQLRRLSIHEYQAQGLLREADILVPTGSLATSSKQAQDVANQLAAPCVLKSQILAGGRGKGHFDNGLKGGIHLVEKPDQAVALSEQMFGHRLITKQTSPTGLLVDKIYITETVKYTDEYYLAITVDRESYCPAVIISKQGGMNVEDISRNDLDSLLKIRVDYSTGIDADAILAVGSRLGLTAAESEKLRSLLRKMFKIFVDKDATLLEINPLVRTTEGEFLCLDSKFTFDNAAKPRQPELFAMRDKGQEHPDELEAEKSGLVYVRLEGNIGNVVNGAGLAMATNDAISFYGGKSANFLDAGGQATAETMVNAFEIILRDDRVKTILVNIYGGIIKCDMIAESVITAAARLGPLRVPVVVRLQGTNAEEGQKMIAESGLDLISAVDFGEAARIAVEKAGEYVETA